MSEEFNFTINYPLPENEKEFNERVASAIARALIQTYHPEVIEEIIKIYKNKKVEEKTK